jgi:hypothetical protein
MAAAAPSLAGELPPNGPDDTQPKAQRRSSSPPAKEPFPQSPFSPDIAAANTPLDDSAEVVPGEAPMADSEMHRAQPAASGPQPKEVQTARAQKPRKRLKQMCTGMATGEALSGSDSDIELLAEMDGCQRGAPADTRVQHAHSAGAEDDSHAKEMLPERGGCQRAASSGMQVQQAPDAGTEGAGYALDDMEAASMSDVKLQQEQSSGLQLLFPESAAHIRWDFSTAACCQMTKDTDKICIQHSTEA